MEALHLRAKPETISQIIKIVNQVSKGDHTVEILDNTTFVQEQQMVFKALIEEKNEEVFSHKELWNELLTE